MFSVFYHSEVKNNMKKIIIVLAVIFIMLVCFLYFGNNSIVTNKITVTPADLPEGFDGFKIIHISDLHNKSFNGRLIKKIRDNSPDIIVISGDLIDAYHTEPGISVDFIRGIIDVAPIYYVTGNHENRIPEYDAFRDEILSLGVNIIDNRTVFLERNGDEIALCGIADYESFGSIITDEAEIGFNAMLDKLYAETNGKTSILLSHRPEQLEAYSQRGFSLVFSGHAHGGQIRLPFTDGLFAPNQGFMPSVTSGVHKRGSTEMVVSRGLGASIFPFRIFNRPELIICELKVK